MEDKAESPYDEVQPYKEVEKEGGTGTLWHSCTPERIRSLVGGDPTRSSMIFNLGLQQTFGIDYNITAVCGVKEFVLGFDYASKSSEFRGCSLKITQDVLRAAFKLPSGTFAKCRQRMHYPEFNDLFVRPRIRGNPYSLKLLRAPYDRWSGAIRVVQEILLGKEKPSQLSAKQLSYFYWYLCGTLPKGKRLAGPVPKLLPDWSDLVYDELALEISKFKKHLQGMRNVRESKAFPAYCGTAITQLLLHWGFSWESLILGPNVGNEGTTRRETQPQPIQCKLQSSESKLEGRIDDLEGELTAQTMRNDEYEDAGEGWNENQSCMANLSVEQEICNAGRDAVTREFEVFKLQSQCRLEDLEEKLVRVTMRNDKYQAAEQGWKEDQSRMAELSVELQMGTTGRDAITNKFEEFKLQSQCTLKDLEENLVQVTKRNDEYQAAEQGWKEDQSRMTKLSVELQMGTAERDAVTSEFEEFKLQSQSRLKDLEEKLMQVTMRNDEYQAAEQGWKKDQSRMAELSVELQMGTTGRDAITNKFEEFKLQSQCTLKDLEENLVQVTKRNDEYQAAEQGWKEDQSRMTKLSVELQMGTAERDAVTSEFEEFKLQSQSRLKDLEEKLMQVTMRNDEYQAAEQGWKKDQSRMAELSVELQMGTTGRDAITNKFEEFKLQSQCTLKDLEENLVQVTKRNDEYQAAEQGWKEDQSRMAKLSAELQMGTAERDAVTSKFEEFKLQSQWKLKDLEEKLVQVTKRNDEYQAAKQGWKEDQSCMAKLSAELQMGTAERDAVTSKFEEFKLQSQWKLKDLEEKLVQVTKRNDNYQAAEQGWKEDSGKRMAELSADLERCVAGRDAAINELELLKLSSKSKFEDVQRKVVEQAVCMESCLGAECALKDIQMRMEELESELAGRTKQRDDVSTQLQLFRLESQSKLEDLQRALVKQTRLKAEYAIAHKALKENKMCMGELRNEVAKCTAERNTQRTNVESLKLDLERTMAELEQVHCRLGENVDLQQIVLTQKVELKFKDDQLHIAFAKVEELECTMRNLKRKQVSNAEPVIPFIAEPKRQAHGRPLLGSTSNNEMTIVPVPCKNRVQRDEIASCSLSVVSQLTRINLEDPPKRRRLLWSFDNEGDSLDHVDIDATSVRHTIANSCSDSDSEMDFPRVRVQPFSQAEEREYIDDRDFTGEASPPDGLMQNVTVYQHQRKGLFWMLSRESGDSQCFGGILADDQGMGKTIQLITLLVTNRPPRSKTLIVCPGSVMTQWKREITTKTTARANVKVLIFHGSDRCMDPKQLDLYDVIITTYGTLAQHSTADPPTLRRKGKLSQKIHVEPTPKKTKDPLPPCLEQVQWYRVILDECQAISNHRSGRALAACNLHARSRWCVSGTPVSNSTWEAYSYFKFLGYPPYCDIDRFKILRQHIAKSRKAGHAILHKELRAITLRRDKSILNLPKKHVRVAHLDFLVEGDAIVYKKLEARSAAEDSKGNKKEKAKLLSLMLRMRRHCGHRDLVFHNEKEDSVNTPKIQPDGVRSGELVNKLLDAPEGVTCNKCQGELFDDPMISICGHYYCSSSACYFDPLEEDIICGAPHCKQQISWSTVYRVCDICTSSGTELAEEDLEILGFHTSGPSPKIDGVMSYLNELRESGSDHKTIVFSQWTGLIDLLQGTLESANIQFTRVDGSMSLEKRDQNLRDFAESRQIQVALLSLKAANTGLNIMAANHVLFTDIWWNPTAEDQAVDRTHRLGQTKEVFVTHFLMRNTIEETLWHVQQRKRTLIDECVHGSLSSGKKDNAILQEVLKEERLRLSRQQAIGRPRR